MLFVFNTYFYYNVCPVFVSLLTEGQHTLQIQKRERF